MEGYRHPFVYSYICDTCFTATRFRLHYMILFRGIPQEFRWESWKVALKFDHYLPIVSSDYEELACKTNEYSTLIQIDVPRCAF